MCLSVSSELKSKPLDNRVGGLGIGNNIFQRVLKGQGMGVDLGAGGLRERSQSQALAPALPETC